MMSSSSTTRAISRGANAIRELQKHNKILQPRSAFGCESSVVRRRLAPRRSWRPPAFATAPPPAASSPASNETTGEVEMVDIQELLSTCVHASLLGCEAIREVQSRREAGGAGGKVAQVDIRFDPALKAPGFNSLKVHPFRAIGFKIL